MRNLYQIDATTGATRQLLPLGTAYSPMALAYDSTARMLYWTDVAAHTVNRYSMITNTSTVIYRDPTNVGKYQACSPDCQNEEADKGSSKNRTSLGRQVERPLPSPPLPSP